MTKELVFIGNKFTENPDFRISAIIYTQKLLVKIIPSKKILEQCR